MDTPPASAPDEPEGVPPPDEPMFAEDGTDLSLIRWMLSLTPEQRLRALQAHMQSAMRMRHELDHT